MIDRLGVAGEPFAVFGLKLLLHGLDLVPVDLALELVLNHGPLGGREHGGVEAPRSLSVGGRSLGILLWLLSRRAGCRTFELGGVAARISGAFAEHLDLGGRRLLGPGARVDLAGVGIRISCLLLGLPVSFDSSGEGRAIVAQLVLQRILEVMDGRLVPDVIDVTEAAPERRMFIQVADEVINVVLLGGSEGAELSTFVNDELDELLLDDLLIGFGEALVEAVDDGVGWKWWHLLLRSHS